MTRNDQQPSSQWYKTSIIFYINLKWSTFHFLQFYRNLFWGESLCFGEAPSNFFLIPLARTERIPLQTLGKMGKYCHTKIVGGMGTKEHFSFLFSTRGKMWMETLRNYQSVDRSYHSEVHCPIQSDRLGEKTRKKLERWLNLLESNNKIIHINKW